ncbi:hypothetical protein DL767_004072 [Monosporascus sp. MG133]|nr:hypothetical protein DL767_004072 [Monosporascus sp. MG133]
MNTIPSTYTGTLFGTIDTFRVDGNGGDEIMAVSIRSAVENVCATNDDASWRCRSVAVDPKSSNRIKIAHASGLWVLRDERYRIKVDNAKRTAALGEHGEIRAGATKAFSEEIDTKVAKIG